MVSGISHGKRVLILCIKDFMPVSIVFHVVFSLDS